MAAPREARVWRAHHHAGSSGHRATLGALGQLRAFAPVRVPVTCHCDWATGSLTPTQASLWENRWGAVELGVGVSGASPRAGLCQGPGAGGRPASQPLLQTSVEMCQGPAGDCVSVGPWHTPLSSLTRKTASEVPSAAGAVDGKAGHAKGRNLRRRCPDCVDNLTCPSALAPDTAGGHGASRSSQGCWVQGTASRKGVPIRGTSAPSSTPLATDSRDTWLTA